MPNPIKERYADGCPILKRETPCRVSFILGSRWGIQLTETPKEKHQEYTKSYVLGSKKH